MNWILTALLLGSVVTSTHETEEACLGRKAVLQRVKELTAVECHQVRGSLNLTLGQSTSLCMVYDANGRAMCR